MSKKKNTEEETLEFEIKFFQGLLEKKPDFVEALAALGDLYTKQGEVLKGLAIDEKLVQLRPDDPVVLYNLACSYSLINQKDKAFRSIKLAINCGYRDFNHLEHDEDLVNLLSDSRFIRYFQRIKQRLDEVN